MLRLETRNDITPLCPFCEVELHTIHMRELAGVLGKRFIYFCSRCRKVLGVSHRKGFWMG